MNKIITIGREFGSGGRELGRRLSEELKIAYYDREIIQEIAKRTALSEQYVKAVEERLPSAAFPIHIGNSFYLTQNPLWEQSIAVYREQFAILKELAEKSDCIIVGRCADSILKDYHPFRIFVYADLESKIRRCREKAPAGEALTDRELKQKMMDIDKSRAKYYGFYTDKQWGDKLNFDLCINTSHTVIKKLVPHVAKIFEQQ